MLKIIYIVNKYFSVNGTYIFTVFAILSCKSALTYTRVSVSWIHTAPSITTGGTLTMIDDDVTSFPSITIRTRTLEVIHKIETWSAVLTGIWWTVICVDVTSFPAKSRFTLTRKIVDKISTHSSIQTRWWLTLVDVNFTSFPAKTLPTVTDEIVVDIWARSPILARWACASVHFDLTRVSCETGDADALVTILDVLTASTIDAGVVSAFVSVLLASLPFIPTRAPARKTRRLVHTSRSILTWVTFTKVWKRKC